MSRTTQICERYRAGLTAKLDTFATDRDRRFYLDAEAGRKAKQFAAWKRQVDRGAYFGETTAFDFHIAMTDIEALRIKYGRVAA